MTNLPNLIPRIEHATGPSRELDNEIAFFTALPTPADCVGWPPKYTESIDAARTILPAGRWWILEHIGRGLYMAHVALGDLDDDLASAQSVNPALALATAGLKALVGMKPARPMHRANK